MTAPTLKLSDLAPGDVAVFVRADGDGEQFVVLDQCRRREAALIHKVTDNSPYWSGWEGYSVRRLGRGRLEPARIEMEGEADLAEQVQLLREALMPFAELDRTIGDEWQPECESARAALAATAATPTEDRK